MAKQYMKYIAVGGVALEVNKEIEKGAKVILMVPFLQTDNFGSYTAGYNVLFEKDEKDPNDNEKELCTECIRIFRSKEKIQNETK